MSGSNVCISCLLVYVETYMSFFYIPETQLIYAGVLPHVNTFDLDDDFPIFLLDEKASISSHGHSSPPSNARFEQPTVQEILHSCAHWAGFPAKGQENMFSHCLCFNSRKPSCPTGDPVITAMATTEDEQVALQHLSTSSQQKQMRRRGVCDSAPCSILVPVT